MLYTMRRFSHSKEFKIFEDYLELTFGALIVALGVAMFLLPNKVISAGVTGIAMIFEILFRWPTGTVNLVLNIPLLLAAALGSFSSNPRALLAQEEDGVM